jgi:type I restriction enzyme R subunit
MRHLIDTYIRAEESEKISAFDDLSLIQLIVERGAGAVDALPDGIKESQEAVAETIENNVRRLIINESPVDPAYYERMSKLLDALIAQRREGVLSYKEYLEDIARLTKAAHQPGGEKEAYPPAINTAGRRALYNNLAQDEALALAVDTAVLANRQDGWRDNAIKTKRVRRAVRAVLEKFSGPPAEDPVETGMPNPPYAGEEGVEAQAERILELVKNQNEY